MFIYSYSPREYLNKTFFSYLLIKTSFNVRTKAYARSYTCVCPSPSYAPLAESSTPPVTGSTPLHLEECSAVTLPRVNAATLLSAVCRPRVSSVFAIYCTWDPLEFLAIFFTNLGLGIKVRIMILISDVIVSPIDITNMLDNPLPLL